MIPRLRLNLSKSERTQVRGHQNEYFRNVFSIILWAVTFPALRTKRDFRIPRPEFTSWVEEPEELFCPLSII